MKCLVGWLANLMFLVTEFSRKDYKFWVVIGFEY